MRQRESSFEPGILDAPPGSAARFERITQYQQAWREFTRFDQ